jgi:hypothetical protein
MDFLLRCQALYPALGPSRLSQKRLYPLPVMSARSAESAYRVPPLVGGQLADELMAATQMVLRWM